MQRINQMQCGFDSIVITLFGVKIALLKYLPVGTREQDTIQSGAKDQIMSNFHYGPLDPFRLAKYI